MMVPPDSRILVKRILLNPWLFKTYIRVSYYTGLELLVALSRFGLFQLSSVVTAGQIVKLSHIVLKGDSYG